MPLIKFEIKGMHCKSCKMLIEDIMDESNASVLSMEIDEQNEVGHVQVDTDTPTQEIIDAIQSEGDYTVKEIK